MDYEEDDSEVFSDDEVARAMANLIEIEESKGTLTIRDEKGRIRYSIEGSEVEAVNPVYFRRKS